MTLLKYIYANGSSIPPLVIFTSEILVQQWVSSDFDAIWKFSNRIKGWTSTKHAIMWLKQYFEPATRDKADGRHQLLICDGHDSHYMAHFLAHCIEHKILLFLLILHSFHIV